MGCIGNHTVLGFVLSLSPSLLLLSPSSFFLLLRVYRGDIEIRTDDTDSTTCVPEKLCLVGPWPGRGGREKREHHVGGARLRGGVAVKKTRVGVNSSWGAGVRGGHLTRWHLTKV